MQIYDVVIVGAGAAGLYSAFHLPKNLKVLIVAKESPWECNSFYAQGGVSVSADRDDVELHITDTINAGVSLNDPKAVRVMSEEARGAIDNLLENGFEFDKDENGMLLYTKEAAHSRDRILHAGGDATGRHLHLFLMENNPHPILFAPVVDLLVESGVASGVTVYEDGEYRNIYAKQTILASGGVGSLMELHTNAHTISGDIQGICVEKGLKLERMEMLQFHPTVFISPDRQGARKQLLSEALRGEGAQIIDEDNRRFLYEYDRRGELAPRDIVSRAIFDYSRKSGKKTYLSFKTFDGEYLIKRFPNIYLNLKMLGFDITKEAVPISPAFHYAIGGVKTDTSGKVEGVKNLYAVGEVASTGVHGANRLASNSLLEALVYAKLVVENLLENRVSLSVEKKISIDVPMELEGDKAIKSELRRKMWENVGIVRTTKGLKDAEKFIFSMLQRRVGRLLKLRLLTAQEIVKSALNQTQSIGVHYLINEEK